MSELGIAIRLIQQFDTEAELEHGLRISALALSDKRDVSTLQKFIDASRFVGWKESREVSR